MDNGTVRKLPLWKSCFEKMEAEGLEYGKIYPVHFFEHELSAKMSTIGYQTGIIEIRHELEQRGFWLKGSPQRAGIYQIVMPDKNRKAMNDRQSRARSLIARAITLGVNTDRRKLTADQVQKHDSVLNRAQLRLALIDRPRTIERFLQKHMPRLLSGKATRS